MAKEIVCTICGANWHYQSFCPLKPKKPIKISKRPRKVSDKQAEYNLWLEEVARPAVIARDGPNCACCGLLHPPMDLDHVLNKGGLYAALKRDIGNLQLLGRFPCHRRKTDKKPCPH